MIVTWYLCVALIGLHVIFGIAEMFFWKPLGALVAKNRDRCGLDDRNLGHAITWSWFLAFNQGIYNLFLAAGLFFCLEPGQTVDSEFVYFFAGCIVAAGLAGAYCGIRTTLIVQTLPGMLLLGANYFAL
ncbi:MAG: DUF1304 family protein [Pseudomonadota bacterium]